MCSAEMFDRADSNIRGQGNRGHFRSTMQGLRRQYVTSKNSTQMPVNILVLVSQHEPYRGCCAHQPRPELHERVSQHEPYKGHSAHQSRPPEVHAPASQYKPCRSCGADQPRPLLQLGCSTPAQPGQILNLRLTTKSPALSRHSQTQMLYVVLFVFSNAHLM